MYEQAICLKHYAANHPNVELRLFAATQTRLVSFRALDLSFAKSFELWTEIEKHPDIDRFLQFQVRDDELNRDVLSRLPEDVAAKFDRANNLLPWTYLREHDLIPPPGRYQLGLSETGSRELLKIADANGVSTGIWDRPTLNFLWRYRQGGGAISNFGQKSKENLVHKYSVVFRRIIAEFDCHVLVCGMNIVTTDSNRAVTDNKYPNFGLDLPDERVTYMKGLSWPLELEIASRATVCCGHASGFTEGLWLKRGADMVLMDAPPHYLAKIAYHRMPLFHLDRSLNLAAAFFRRSPDYYRRKIEAMIREAA